MTPEKVFVGKNADASRTGRSISLRNRDRIKIFANQTGGRTDPFHLGNQTDLRIVPIVAANSTTGGASGTSRSSSTSETGPLACAISTRL